MMERQAQLAMDLLNHVDYGVVLIDMHHHVQVWNHWMEHQTGVCLRDIGDRSIELVLPDIFSTKVFDAINETLEYGQVITFASEDKRQFFFEIKPITLAEKKFCLLHVFDSELEHPSHIADLDELNFQHNQELAVTSHLLDKISGMNAFSLPGLEVWQKEKQLGHFSGDIVLNAQRPSGGVNILIADFVGQGLPAAVGVLPMAEVFYGMTQKGFGLSDIIEEINKKLLFVLPEGFFCAACMLELEQRGNLLAVWNGGLPELLIIDRHSKVKQRVVSSHIPLGIHAAQKNDLETVFVELDAEDKIFCCTDGAIRAQNTAGEQFGRNQLETLLLQGKTLQAIQEKLCSHIGNAQQEDDISLIGLDISVMQSLDNQAVSEPKQRSLPPSSWKAEFEFTTKVLQTVDLVPLLINVLMQIQSPHEHRQRIYTVLAEMCTNALEHGVLGLKSEMKHSANGFAEYYAVRGQRLASLEEGYIKVSLCHQAEKNGGKLTIRVEDSGNGFDYLQHKREIDKDKALCGRGELLLQKLCRRYAYEGRGNIIVADYHWTE
jgi:anti-sigma regulatory factor (Ser/Thr protein kinase)